MASQGRQGFIRVLDQSFLAGFIDGGEDLEATGCRYDDWFRGKTLHTHPLWFGHSGSMEWYGSGMKWYGMVIAVSIIDHTSIPVLCWSVYWYMYQWRQSIRCCATGVRKGLTQ